MRTHRVGETRRTIFALNTYFQSKFYVVDNNKSEKSGFLFFFTTQIRFLAKFADFDLMEIVFFLYIELLLKYLLIEYKT